MVAGSAVEWLGLLSLIFGGCCSNVASLELLTRQAPSAGSLITLGQFLIVSLIGLPSMLEWRPQQRLSLRLKRKQIPLTRHALQLVLYFLSSWLNNRALEYHIPIPVHIIFRSAGLPIGMCLGYCVGKRYTPGQVVAVILVSYGIVLATFSASGENVSIDVQGQGTSFILGITLLGVAIVLSGIMGLWQESTFRIYGKHWQEGMFYSHLLALPLFIPMSGSLVQEARSFSSSRVEPLSLGIARLALPRLWCLFAVNLATQYICVSGVNRLTTRASALTLTLVLNLRKFLSLALSVGLMGSQSTRGMVYGSLAVALGTVLYAVSGRKGEKGKEPSKEDDRQERSRPFGMPDQTQKTVLVTVGTTRFDRLIAIVTQESVLSTLARHGYQNLNIQYGHGPDPFTSLISEPGQLMIAGKTFSFAPSLAAEIDRADLVISHAGSGSILESLRAHKPLIVVVNEELLENHQLEVAEALAKDNFLVYTNVQRMSQSMHTLLTQATSLKKYPDQERTQFQAILTSVLKSR